MRSPEAGNSTVGTSYGSRVSVQHIPSPQKDEGQRPVINLQVVDTKHFKMEGIHTVKNLLQWD